MQTFSKSAWPLVGRDDELGQALAALEDNAEFQGVVFVGDSGIGKSSLARALAEDLESRGCTVHWVHGTATGKAVPLGAFYWLLRPDTGHEPAEMLAAAKAALERKKKLILVVDDAQWLDPLSATLVHRLAAQRTTRLIVTVRAGDPIPQAIAALAKDRLLLRLRIDPFSCEQTAELIRATLGDTVDAGLVDELQSRSAGNPLMIRGLLDAGRRSGALVSTGRGWELRGTLRLDRQLYDLLEFRLQSLAPKEQEAVEILAAVEGLAWEIVRDLCDAEAVVHLQRGGVIQVVAEQTHTMARLTHPIMAEAAMRRAGGVRTRQLNSRLAQALRKQMQT